MYGNIPLLLLLLACGGQNKSIEIEAVNYKNTTHFKINTSAATYYLEQQSGGFSSIIDDEGNDWVNYRKSEEVTVPKSADSDFRGLPNLLHGGEQSGIGHPGFDMCQCEPASKNQITCESNNGNYAFTYTFFDEYVALEVNKADPERNYWFLYEGTPGGNFDPQTDIWGTPAGIRHDKPDFLKGGTVEDNWEWVFFGDEKAENTFYLVHLTADDKPDVMGYMGNTEAGIDSEDGMVVFGFGRDRKTTPLLSGNQKFLIGFRPYAMNSDSDYEKLKSDINKIKSQLSQ